MSDIRTYSDLQEEKKRLEAVLCIQKEIIHHDLIELREEFKPVLKVLSMVGKITNRNGSNPLIAMGVNLVGEVFLGNLALTRGTKLVRLVVPFLAKKVSSYFQKNDRATIFQKLAGIWKKARSNGHAVN